METPENHPHSGSTSATSTPRCRRTRHGLVLDVITRIQKKIEAETVLWIHSFAIKMVYFREVTRSNNR